MLSDKSDKRKTNAVCTRSIFKERTKQAQTRGTRGGGGGCRGWEVQTSTCRYVLGRGAQRGDRSSRTVSYV